MMWCCTCKLATRLPSGFCSSGPDELLSECMFVDAAVYRFMFGCVCVSGPACMKNSTSLQMQSILRILWIWKFLPALLRDSEKHSYRVLGCSSLNPLISDLFLLRNPNIVWLFLKSFSLIWQGKVHRKGKWVAAKSVLHCEFDMGGAEGALNFKKLKL